MTDLLIHALREDGALKENDDWRNLVCGIAANRIEKLEEENDKLRKDQSSLKAAAKKALKGATEMDNWHRYGEGYEVLIKLAEGIAED